MFLGSDSPPIEGLNGAVALNSAGRSHVQHRPNVSAATPYSALALELSTIAHGESESEPCGHDVQPIECHRVPRHELLRRVSKSLTPTNDSTAPSNQTNGSHTIPHTPFRFCVVAGVTRGRP